MLDIYVIAGAALLGAAWLRLQFEVLFRDGLMVTGGIFLAYLLVAAVLNR